MMTKKTSHPAGFFLRKMDVSTVGRAIRERQMTLKRTSIEIFSEQI